MNFSNQNKYIFCENTKVSDILAQVSETPFYLYSAQQIRENVEAYTRALAGLPAIVSYAIKANGNLTILKMMCQLNTWATLVSGNELKLALTAGFKPDNLIFNGNGKTLPELELAVEYGALINIDSQFDLRHIHQTASQHNKTLPVLLRINPNIDPGVHPYIATGLRESKFGLNLDQIPEILSQLKKMPRLNLVGVHCHLGSTITQMDVFRQTMAIMAKIFEYLHTQGFPMRYLNLGGGLGINYQHGVQSFPTPADLVSAIQDSLPPNATLILEPGRSLIGNAGALVCRVIGVKSNGSKNFIVTDGSMTELIRPSLYQAYHEIAFIEPQNGQPKIFDIVGPVCESADFLGKDRLLPTPKEGDGLVILDVGAYGFAMSSNYNARSRSAEYLVDGANIIQIRRAERFEDQLRLFMVGG